MNLSGSEQDHIADPGMILFQSDKFIVLKEVDWENFTANTMQHYDFGIMGERLTKRVREFSREGSIL